MTCLSSIKFNMLATVVRNYAEVANIDAGAGSFEPVYDPITGEQTDVYVSKDLTPFDGQNTSNEVIPCLVTANVTLQSSNETLYRQTRVVDSETLTLRCAPRYHLFTTDRITSITNKLGELIYEDDQLPQIDESQIKPRQVPAQYRVDGVTPITDPFGRVVERHVTLKKVR